MIVVVEGRHDIEFLRRISSILYAVRPSLPDLPTFERRGELLFVPAGGDDFRPWLTRLSALGRAEVHLYDCEAPPVSQQREQWAALVDSRPNCRAFVTRYRSRENYLHPDAIRAAWASRFRRPTTSLKRSLGSLFYRASTIQPGITFRAVPNIGSAMGQGLAQYRSGRANDARTPRPNGSGR